MINNESSNSNHPESKSHVNDKGIAGGIYGMAFLGAAIYFIQHASTFWLGVLGFFKALVWPALLIYKMLEFLKM